MLKQNKQTIYWPGLYDQIHELVTDFQTCLKFVDKIYKQPPSQQLGQEIPLVAWSKVTGDIYHCKGCSYLIVVDYYTMSPVICNRT